MVMQSYTMCFFFFNDTATTEIYTLSLHDALPISRKRFDSRERRRRGQRPRWLHAEPGRSVRARRSEEHTSELQSRSDLVCRLLLEKKKTNHERHHPEQSVDKVRREIDGGMLEPHT